MNVLRKFGPLNFHDLYEAVSSQYPGVVGSKQHLKKRILGRALVHQLTKVRIGDAAVKDAWAIRKPGQVRMRAARKVR